MTIRMMEQANNQPQYMIKKTKQKTKQKQKQKQNKENKKTRKKPETQFLRSFRFLCFQTIVLEPGFHHVNM